MKIKYPFTYMTIAALSLAGATALAEQKPAESGEKIEDNSFFLEEAYNQERGVVQFIQGFQYMKNKSWNYSFTNEIPVPDETHQFSYTIPITHMSGSPSTTGVGDILLNYRHQLIKREGLLMAPRFSVVLPTGKYQEGTGTGSVGFQVNHTVTVEVSSLWVTHWNFGATYTPNAKEASGAKADTLGFNYGTSVIYMPSSTFNLMLEIFGTTGEVVTSNGQTEKAETFFISPGFRYAINLKSGTQIVPGLAVPIGVGPSKNEYSLFAYLSIEPKLW